MDNKKSAASAANTGDTEVKNIATDIIAQAIAEGKTAVWIKRDGWTISPQLPKEPGWYIQVNYCEDEDGNIGLSSDGSPFLSFFPWLVNQWEIDNGRLDKAFRHCVCWMRLPDITDWQRQLVPNQTGMTVE